MVVVIMVIMSEVGGNNGGGREGVHKSDGKVDACEILRRQLGPC